MARMLTAKPITESIQPGKECYEINWIIPMWRDIRKSKNFVKCQEALFETGSSPSAWFKTKWLVGLKVVSSTNGNGSRRIRLYWKLLGISGPQAIKVEASFQTQLLHYVTAKPKYTDEKSQEVKLLGIVEETNECLQFNPDDTFTDIDIIGAPGKVTYKLRLTLKTPTMSSTEYDRYKMDQFWRKSVEQLIQNQAAMLTDHCENADVKIVTSDEVEILAHGTILKAQCPIFSAMLNCDLSKNATGIIRMTDITGKTMKILLHYFYTGELLPSWRDPDTIVEFTYAAGKYQVTRVLELLDDTLGRYFGGDASNLDVQLISLAGKLKLVNGEARLLKRIVAQIKKLVTSVELFELFGYAQKEVLELAENFGDERVVESGVLGIMDFLYGDPASGDFFKKGKNLLALVGQEEFKKFEKILLGRFAQCAGYLKNAEELLELFGCGKQMGK